MYVDWLPEYSVEVEEIDEQHKKFVLLINDLADSLEIGCEEIALGDVIKQLQAYAEYHFATEEKYFDQFDYPGSVEHKKAHQEFREKVAAFDKKYPGNEKKIASDVMEFMRDWLMNHIITMDKEYTACFKEHGLK